MHIKHYIEEKNGIHTIWIQNHSKKREFFRSDDEEVVKQRFKEINADIKKCNNNRIEVLLALYKFAERGCISVWKPRGPVGSGGVLKIKPVGENYWNLVLARGAKECLVDEGDSISPLKDRYIELMKEKVWNPNLFNDMWDSLSTESELVVR